GPVVSRRARCGLRRRVDEPAPAVAVPPTGGVECTEETDQLIGRTRTRCPGAPGDPPRRVDDPAPAVAAPPTGGVECTEEPDQLIGRSRTGCLGGGGGVAGASLVRAGGG